MLFLFLVYDCLTHLRILKGNLFTFFHSVIAFKSLWSFTQSISFSIDLKSFISSANSNMFEYCIKLVIEFINNRKSKGPSFEPCGIPDFAIKQKDWNPEYVTNCILLCRYGLKILSILGESSFFNLINNNSWFTLSNAFWKSVKTTSTCIDFSKCSDMYLVKLHKFVIVDFLA